MNYATNKQYTIEKIMDLINNYPFYIKRIIKLRERYLTEVAGGNISQYGIESSLPKPQGNNSDPVYNEMQRLLKMDKELSRLEYKVRYIQNRSERVVDERLGLVFNMRLSGKTYQEIADELEVTKPRVNQLMNEICTILQD